MVMETFRESQETLSSKNLIRNFQRNGANSYFLVKNIFNLFSISIQYFQIVQTLFISKIPLLEPQTNYILKMGRDVGASNTV